MLPKYAINVTLTAFLEDIPAVSEFHARDIAHTEMNGLIDEKVQYQIEETEIFSVSEESYRED
jgi:hypothetical protein